ncbi:Exocyst complex component 6B [Acipenser ruthenus]|uniref:Exocyst complex component n=1 Tax=Acipenser ruthenus TaxID=7906 RepID=A0A444U5A4_ACIRT|nr:Exocyst complex component 6B [Acipenser ruthenus]
MASLEAAAENERILREIESTDSNCIGPTLRSVYDGQEHGHFMEKLEGRIRNHDRDIEKMCNFHYQGFVDSITELLKVRGEAQKLKSQVTDTNSKLQDAGKELVNSMEELKQCRLQQRNIAATVDKLSLCLPVLEMYNKLQEQMQARRHYPALKTLEQLELIYLPRASQYRFCKIMSENIPKLRSEIKDLSMSDLKDFLENPMTPVAHLAQQQRSLDSIVSNQQRAGSARRARKEAGLGTELEGDSSSPMSEQDSGILDVEDEEDEEVLGAQDLVDFSPVYRCLHIYTVLGLIVRKSTRDVIFGEMGFSTCAVPLKCLIVLSGCLALCSRGRGRVGLSAVLERGARDTFENYYRKQRRKQARLVLQPHSNMHETLEGYRKYFNQIVGFFVVEDHILHTTQGLVNRAYVDELWDLALSKTIAALRTHSSYCTDPNLVLDLKNLIVLFADTLQGFGFPVNQLFDMLLEIRDQYSEILLKKWTVVFRQILDQDNYSPIPVVSEEVYRKTAGQFPFQDPELEKLPFPKKFPFSEFVPKVYSQLKEFIYACLKFSEDLHLSSTEIDDMIRKSTNLLLARTLSNCLQNVIKRRNVGLTELVQIIINTTHLEQSCRYLEEFITNITNVPPETVQATKLYGTSTFKDARHTAEEEIYTNLNQKIDQFLQLADYDWMAAQGSCEPSDYLSDLIAFLYSTFTVFTHLPWYRDKHSNRRSAVLSTCKRPVRMTSLTPALKYTVVYVSRLTL